MTKPRIQVFPQVLADVGAHVLGAPDYEQGGFLGGTGERVSMAVPVINRSLEPAQGFQPDLGEFDRALERMAAQDLELVGGYHSHPRGSAIPSPADWRTADSLGLMLIVAVESWEWLFWRPGRPEGPALWVVDL